MGKSQDVAQKFSMAGLLITLGIVYGDIGTSPLYVMKAIVGDQAIEKSLVLGGLSCIFWTLTIQTTVKYVIITLRADNDGEGGIPALYALVRRKARWLVVPAIIGTAALLADGLITPPISVTSAIEGLRLIREDIPVIPIVVIIISTLFFFQQFGTKFVGKAFGPIMLLWFGTLGTLGALQILQHADVLAAINPWHAIELLMNYPGGFILLGAVFLCTTGAEALYSDLGHCGVKNIRITWAFVKTALLLNYFGQGAWLLYDAGDKLGDKNPFYQIMPEWFLIPGIILASLATIIASQALISGSYTLVQEAMKLKFWPRLKVIYPTDVKGQLYIPFVNWSLLAGCLFIVFFFRESENMEAAYGLTITITMIMTTVLLMFYLRKIGTAWIWIILCGILFSVVEFAFLYANLNKFMHGGYVTIIIGALLSLMMWIWYKGHKITRRYEKNVDIADYYEMFKDLSADESVPKFASNLVYIDSQPMNVVEHKILYSIFNKQPKRADTYWIIHVKYTDEPHTRQYSVDEMIPGLLIKVDFKLGFQVEPRINMFLRNVIKDLQENEEIDLTSKHESMKKHEIPSDFRFVIIEKIPTYDYQLPVFQEIVMSIYYFIKRISLTDDKAYELDTSLVTKEKVPLIISRTTDEKLERVPLEEIKKQ